MQPNDTIISFMHSDSGVWNDTVIIYDCMLPNLQQII